MATPRDPDSLYTITELSDEVGATARAIRFYESKGLLHPRRAGANRVYTYRDRARLLIILRGKRLGFSLARIQEYLSLYDADPTHKGQLEHLLSGTRRRIEELEAQRADLDLTLGELREIEDLTLEALARTRAAGRGAEKRRRAISKTERRSPSPSPSPSPSSSSSRPRPRTATR